MHLDNFYGRVALVVTAVLVLLLGCQAYPKHRRRSIKEVEVGEHTHLDNDDGETWYPVENINESEDPDSNNHDHDHDQGSQSQETTKMIQAIRDTFLKWGYKLDEIPRPFGTMDPSKPFHTTPEFSELLLALVDKLPPDLEKVLRDMLARAHNGPPTLEEMQSNTAGHAHQEEPDEYPPHTGDICEENIGAACSPGEGGHSAAWTSDHPSVQTGELFDSTHKKRKPLTTTTTPRPPETTTMSKVDEHLAEIEKLKKEHGWDRVQLNKDESLLEDLLLDLKDKMTKAEDEPLKPEEASQGQAEVDKVLHLLHEVEAMAEVGPPCHDTPAPIKKGPLPENEQMILRQMWKKQNAKVDETSAFQHRPHDEELNPPAEQIHVDQLMANMQRDSAHAKENSAKDNAEMDMVKNLLNDLKPNEVKSHEPSHLTFNQEAEMFSRIIQDIDDVAKLEAKNIEGRNQEISREKLDALMEEVKMMQKGVPGHEHSGATQHSSGHDDFSRTDQVNRILQDLDRESAIERELQHKLEHLHNHQSDVEQFERVKQMQESLQPKSRDRDHDRMWNGMQIPGADQHMRDMDALRKQYGWDKETNYDHEINRVNEQIGHIQGLEKHYGDHPIESQHANADQYADSDRALEEQMHQVQAMQSHPPRQHYQKDQFAHDEYDQRLADTMAQVQNMEAKNHEPHGQNHHDQHAEQDRALADLMHSVHSQPTHTEPNEFDRYLYEQNHGRLEAKMAEVKALNAQYQNEKAQAQDSMSKVNEQLNKIKIMGQPDHRTIAMNVHPEAADHHRQQVDEQLRKIEAMTQQARVDKSHSDHAHPMDLGIDRVNAIMHDLSRDKEKQDIQKLQYMDGDKVDLEMLERMNNDQKVHDVLSALRGHPKYPDSHGFGGNHDHEMDRVNQQLASLQREHEQGRANAQMEDVNKLMAGLQPRKRKLTKYYNRADAEYLSRFKNKQRKNRRQ